MKRRKLIFFLLLIILLPNANIFIAEANETIDSSTEISEKNESESEMEKTLDTSSKSIESSEIPESSSDSEKTSATTESSTSEDKTEQSEIEADDSKIEKTDISLLAADEEAVGTWADFVSAVRNENITKIILTASFSNPSASDSSLSGYSRKNDLEIDGQGYRVDFRNSSIQLGSPTNTTGLFHMHDIVLNQNYVGASSEDIVGTRLNNTNGAKWKYRFGNITTEPGYNDWRELLIQK